MLQEILQDYERALQAAADPKASTRDIRGDRFTDVKSDFITRGYDIQRFYRMYFEVNRGRGQEIQIGIRTLRHRDAEAKGVIKALEEAGPYEE